jgi:hypothetical protein
MPEIKFLKDYHPWIHVMAQLLGEEVQIILANRL